MKLEVLMQLIQILGPLMIKVWPLIKQLLQAVPPAPGPGPAFDTLNVTADRVSSARVASVSSAQRALHDVGVPVEFTELDELV